MGICEIQPYQYLNEYNTHSNDWIDAAKRWYQRMNQKKQNFGAYFRENFIEVQSYPKKSQKYDKIAGLN